MRKGTLVLCGYWAISHLRNNFHFSEVHRNVTAMGSWCRKGVTLTLHRTHCSHTLMNLKKKIMKYCNHASRLHSHHTALKFYVKVFQKFISRQPLVRKHSYLDHRYPGGLAFIPWPWLMGHEVKVTMPCISRSSDFALYLEDYLMYEHHVLGL